MTSAVYPAAIKTFTPHVNNTEAVAAEHVNAIQDEVTSMQSVVGANPLADTLSGTAYTWSSLKDRLVGLHNGDSKWFVNLTTATPTYSSTSGAGYVMFGGYSPPSGRVYSLGTGTAGAGTLSVPVRGIYSVVGNFQASAVTGNTVAGHYANIYVQRAASSTPTTFGVLCLQSAYGPWGQTSYQGLLEAGDVLRLAYTLGADYSSLTAGGSRPSLSAVLLRTL